MRPAVGPGRTRSILLHPILESADQRFGVDLSAAEGGEGGGVAAVAEDDGGVAEQPAAAKLEPIGPLLANADPKRGEQLAKVCVVCHTFNKGGPNKIGPNLWDVTEEEIAAVPNYQFSAALQADKGTKWDPERLNQWLYSPQSFAKGTKMTFAGFPKAQDRADVVAYLDTLK